METFLSSLNNGELNAIKRELSNSRSILQPKFLIISKPDILPSLLPSQKSDSKQILACEEWRSEGEAKLLRDEWIIIKWFGAKPVEQNSILNVSL